MIEEFRRFTIKSKAPRDLLKKLTMPSKADYKRMEARLKIEKLSEEKQLREEWELWTLANDSRAASAQERIHGIAAMV